MPHGHRSGASAVAAASVKVLATVRTSPRRGLVAVVDWIDQEPAISIDLHSAISTVPRNCPAAIVQAQEVAECSCHLGQAAAVDT